MTRVALLNDTGKLDHFGCKLVSKTLRRLFADHGLDLVLSVPCGVNWDTPEYRRILDTVNLVVVNGEGSLHHGREKYQPLVKIAAHYPAVLINSVLQEMPESWLKYTRLFKFISCRESWSARYARDVHANDRVLIVPDVIFASGVKRAAGGRKGVNLFLATDSANRAKLNTPDFMLASNLNFLRKAATYRRWLTGRFHAVCLAAMWGIPFMAYASNTWKIDGLVDDMGVPEYLVNVWDGLAMMAAKKNEPSLPTVVKQYVLQAEAAVGGLMRQVSLAAGKLPEGCPTGCPPALVDRYVGQAALVLGNGPSINDFDLCALAAGKVTIGTNAIGRVFTPDYYVITDPQAWSRWGDVALSCQAQGSTLVLSKAVFDKVHFPPGREHSTIVLDYSHDNIVGEPVKGGPLYHGRTVGVVALNLAYQMGFRRVEMLGIDGYGVQGDKHFHTEHEDGAHKADERDQVVQANLLRLQAAFYKQGGKLINRSQLGVLGVPEYVPFTG